MSKLNPNSILEKSINSKSQFYDALEQSLPSTPLYLPTQPSMIENDDSIITPTKLIFEKQNSFSKNENSIYSDQINEKTPNVRQLSWNEYYMLLRKYLFSFFYKTTRILILLVFLCFDFLQQHI